MSNKNMKLEQAIDIIESHGGLVIMEDDLFDNIKSKENEQEMEEFKRDLARRKKDALKNFDNMLGSKNFSVTAVEDMIHGHGLDLDDLEEMIHSFY